MNAANIGTAAAATRERRSASTSSDSDGEPTFQRADLEPHAGGGEVLDEDLDVDLSRPTLRRPSRAMRAAQMGHGVAPLSPRSEPAPSKRAQPSDGSARDVLSTLKRMFRKEKD